MSNNGYEDNLDISKNKYMSSNNIFKNNIDNEKLNKNYIRISTYYNRDLYHVNYSDGSRDYKYSGFGVYKIYDFWFIIIIS